MDSEGTIDPQGECAASGPSPQRTALDIISVEVTSNPPPAIAEIASQDTLITTPWLQPEFHGDIPGLAAHVVGTYYEAPSRRAWRNGRMHLKGMGRPGAFTIVPAHLGGRWDIEAASPLSYVFLSDRRLQEFSGQSFARGARVELLPRIGEPDPVAVHIMRVLSRHAARPNRVAGMFLEQTLDLLCFHLLRAHSSLGRSAPPFRRRGLLPWQVRRVTAYMRDRLDRNISLGELAGLLDLSRFHFCTAFRLATGQTPHEWLTARRIDHARELLRNPDLRVTDIALAVGYGTPSAFTASFRKATGMTPTDFRRRL
jgi:AraC family transcriptional regulator